MVVSGSSSRAHLQFPQGQAATLVRMPSEIDDARPLGRVSAYDPAHQVLANTAYLGSMVLKTSYRDHQQFGV